MGLEANLQSPAKYILHPACSRNWLGDLIIALQPIVDATYHK